MITDQYGRRLKQMAVAGSGKGTINIDASTFAAGLYKYALVVDGTTISSKQMVLKK